METVMDERYVQGSAAWKEWRRRSLTSSDSAVLMGMSPWQDLRLLWERKKGIAPDAPRTAAMARGSALEAAGREWAEQYFGVTLEPRVVEHPDYPWMISSLDGIDSTGQVLIEIKAPGERVLNEMRTGKIPDYVRCQCGWHCLVSGALSCQLVVFDGFDGFIIPLKPDPEFLEELKARAIDFYGYLQGDVPPPIEENDYVRIESDPGTLSILCQWITASLQLKAIEATEKALRARIVDMSDDGNCVFLDGHGDPLVKLQRIQRTGAVDSDKLYAHYGITAQDLDRFRKKSVGYPKLTKVNG